jgi:hypothetical protein
VYLPRLPIRILKELLLTFTEEDASEAKTYAEELIVMVIADPSSFVFDYVLDLAPVKILEDQPIHKVTLLQLVVPYSCVVRPTSVGLCNRTLTVWVLLTEVVS